MAGRPRKPSRQRELEGNPGRRPIPKEPNVPQLDAAAPDWLPGDAQRLWSEFVPKLRTWIFASQLDEPLIALLCATWGISQQALRKLKREGLTRGGHKNPAAQIWKDNVALFTQMAAKFGMTPADRARLFANEKPKEDIPETDTLDGNWSSQPAGRPN